MKREPPNGESLARLFTDLLLLIRVGFLRLLYHLFNLCS